jgi:transposase
MYAREGRPSIPPEKLLRALVLQILYTIRSVRLLMEQLDYNLLFRWFVGLSMDDKVWDHSVFSKNQERFLDSDLADAFFARIQQQSARAGLLSDEHFTVDGTLIEAWASLKSFRPKDGPPPAGGGGRNPEVDFHGERRLNRTHASTTDPEARLLKKAKGKEAKLCFMGHVLMENRHGLVVAPRLTQASGTAEREAAVALVEAVPGRHRITVGGDKAYDTRELVQSLRALRATPHVAQNHKGRRSAIDGRHHPPSGVRGQSAPAQTGGGDLRVDENCGQPQENPAPRRGPGGLCFHLTAAAYNLVRMRNLLAQVPS